ncbi:hypothetical protein EMIHUDRAFT_205238 [Emiliania huxleyi CCMP1516]|uniref:Uncharacterized protein n=2 Tax=Emiliania huxleyi TaxID=2903 RepID=A0A0D3JUQ3_EMIH1|nr:hypothetical protein EMIHUDRAFT_205238 [Emiliania huxleyi CCMP1516]EOD27238.1 hypothetical protein EMIHUDRAFT_205238 [Emiliania huxleyi CCMP1516]|eukprot:XP_005779667.1 hypothetical protein EMIHUDRAFT_205238 [Emiliania huxleyi CCMP1516]
MLLAATGGAFVVAAAAAPRAAVGWCGEAVPSWAFFVKWDDGRVPFEWEGAKGEAYCRVVGDRAREAKAGVPPILLVGTPGLGYDYLENLEALTVSDRRVVEVVFAGTNGAASAPLLTADACAAQLGAVVRSLGVQKADTCQTASASCVSEAAAAAADGVLLPPLLDRNGDGDSDRLASGGEADIVDRCVNVCNCRRRGRMSSASCYKKETAVVGGAALVGASGHLPFVEQKEEFLTQLLKFADLQSTLREATSAESPLRSAGAERDCSAYKTEAARKYCQTSTRS